MGLDFAFMKGRDTGCRDSHGDTGKDLRDLAKKGSTGLDTGNKERRIFKLFSGVEVG